MIAARLVLHLAAFGLPAIPISAWLIYLGKSLDEGGVMAMLLFLAPAVLAAQTAAWLRWNALQRRASVKSSAWPTGIGMALITHLVFGFFLAIGLALASGFGQSKSDGTVGQLLVQALFFSFVSLMIVGFLTIPVTAWIAHRIGRLREKELTHEPR